MLERRENRSAWVHLQRASVAILNSIEPAKGSNFMKRVFCAALALVLLSSSAASARGWGHDSYGRGYHHYHHHGGDGLALGLGLGILTLGIIAAQNAHERDRLRDDDAYYEREPYPDEYGDRDRAYDDERDRDNYRDNYDDGYRGDDEGE